MLVDAIYELLKGVCANTYPGVSEQEVEAPYIVHAISRTVPNPSKDGESTFDLKILKVACYHNTQREAQILADSVRVVLDEYSGVQSSVDIDRMRFVDEETGYEPEVDAYFTLQTYRIWINYNT